MSNAIDIVTRDEAVAGLNLGSTDVALYPQLERVITSASRLIDRYFGPVINRSVTEHHDPPAGGGPIILHNSPVSSITSVTVDGTVMDSANYTLIRHGDQSFGGLQRTSGGAYLPWRSIYPMGIVVVFVAGRMADTDATTDVAEHFKQAAILQIQHMWRPYQHSVGEINEFDTGALAANTQGLARGVADHLHGEMRVGLA